MIQIAHALTGTIDVSSRYAWGENIGWLDFGSSEGNVVVTDTELTGYVWAENVGWISLNCSNTNSCSSVDFRVTNALSGRLGGYAWGENTGWINFEPGYGADPEINSDGEFIGYAWGENVGWINFNCSNTNFCSTVDFKVLTDWRPHAGGGGGPIAVPPPISTSAPTPLSSSSPIPSATVPPPSSSPTPVVPTSVPPSPLPSEPVSTAAPTDLVPPLVQPPGEPPTGVGPSGPPPVSGPNSLPERVTQSVRESLQPIVRNVVPAVKRVSQPVSNVSIVTVGISTAASAVSVASSGLNVLTYLDFFLKNILVFLGLKKKTRAWGTIYNSVTKQPLPYTKVQLVGPDRRILETRITDREGRYGFLVQEGSFFIVPVRDGFEFPSRKVVGPNDTILYSRVYNGGMVQSQVQELLKYDVPMDPNQMVASVNQGKVPHVNFHNFFAHVSNLMFWVALVIIPLNYIFYPTTVHLVMLIVFAVLNLFILAGDLRQRPYGVVLDRGADTPIPYSLITLNDVTGERKGFTVSDEQGRYFLLSGKGTFKINAHTPAQVSPPRSTEESFSTDRGWIAKKLRL